MQRFDLFDREERCTVSKGRVLAAAAGENNIVAVKNFVQVDRPVTRSFGATLAKEGLLTQAPAQEFEEHMKWGAKQRRTRERNHVKTNVENSVVPLADKVLESVPSPHEVIGWSRAALLKNDTESMIIDLTEEDEDDDECCEMETEEAESQMPNIDEADMDNPLAVTDYVEDIYSFYHEREIISCVPPGYMSLQSDINEKMRAILVDWLIEVHLKFGLMHETLFLAINLFDRYLSSQSVVRKSLQLVGVTSMLLASKYEEIYAPIVEDFVLVSDNAYRKSDILQMEKSILNTLQFNITVPTPYVFMKRFLKAAGSEKDLETVSLFLMELCQVEYIMLKYPPSMLAAAAVYTGVCILRRAPSWSRTMECHTTYTEEQLIECAKLMTGFHQNAGKGKLTSVHKKYSSPKFSCAARLEPAHFIGENYL
ncbi:hypothetical protein SUGI_0515930 [Cryptomeria japonica]|nr:hypothetical protein SUGI_0515930 [Cryptomeria japonica]